MGIVTRSLMKEQMCSSTQACTCGNTRGVTFRKLLASSRKPVFGQIWRSNLHAGWIWWMGWQSRAVVGRGRAPKDEESGGDGRQQCRCSSKSGRHGVHVRARPRASGDGIRSRAGVDEAATTASGRGRLAELLLAVFGRRGKGEATSELNEPTRDKGRRGVSLAWIERKENAVNKIVEVQIIQQKTEDQLYWKHNSSGICNTKSACKEVVKRENQNTHQMWTVGI
uniref:Uncharacterized protein n=1 Tax=Oryza punctata TaxID=4537 RepID=A0A0E0K6E7_ORYPU